MIILLPVQRGVPARADVGRPSRVQNGIPGESYHEMDRDCQGTVGITVAFPLFVNRLENTHIDRVARKIRILIELL